MPRIPLVILLLAISCGGATGCFVPFPHSRVHDLGVAGRVVDDQTNAPVAGAILSGESDEQTGHIQTRIETDARGTFALKPTRRLHGGRAYGTVTLSIWPTFDLPPASRHLSVSAPGYAATEILVTAKHQLPIPNPLKTVPARWDVKDDTLRDCEIRLARSSP